MKVAHLAGLALLPISTLAVDPSLLQQQQAATVIPKNEASNQLASVFDNSLQIVVRELLKNMDEAVIKQAHAAGVKPPPSIAAAFDIGKSLDVAGSSTTNDFLDHALDGAKSIVSGFVEGAEGAIEGYVSGVEEVASGIVNGIHSVFGEHELPDLPGFPNPLIPSKPTPEPAEPVPEPAEPAPEPAPAPAEPAPVPGQPENGVFTNYMHRTMQRFIDNTDSATLHESISTLSNLHKRFFDGFGTGNSPVERIIAEAEAAANAYHEQLEQTNDPNALMEQLMAALRNAVTPELQEALSAADSNIGLILAETVTADEIHGLEEAVGASTDAEKDTGLEGAMVAAIARTIDRTAQEGVEFLKEYARAVNTLVLVADSLTAHYNAADQRLKAVQEAIRNGTVLENDPLYNVLTHIDDYAQFTNSLAGTIADTMADVLLGLVEGAANVLSFAIRTLQAVADSIIGTVFGNAKTPASVTPVTPAAPAPVPPAPPVTGGALAYVPPSQRNKPAGFGILEKIVAAIASENKVLGTVLNKILTFVETVSMADPQFAQDVLNPATIQDALHALLDGIKAGISAK